MYKGVIGVNIDITQPANQKMQGFDIVINPSLQHHLIADHDTPLHQAIETAATYIGDLMWMVKMRVQNNFLVQLTPLLNHSGKRIYPPRIRYQFLRHNRRSLCGVAHTPNVIDFEQAISDVLDVFSFEVRHITTADDDVF